VSLHSRERFTLPTRVPADARLLTLRTTRLLDTATLILPDDLVSQEILALANPAATITPVGKRCGTRASPRQDSR
jgi:siroheme synthase